MFMEFEHMEGMTKASGSFSMESSSDALIEVTLLFLCPEILLKSILYYIYHSNDLATTEIPNIECDKRMTISQYRTFLSFGIDF